ncbi:hypothetical protein [Massilia sp. CCM 8734]|uniref:winged helix-turn-helix transcriptional regulator n=1 Tax=Massilia sp. CCM 8734 TaxID=2609283 RepID=UPI001E5AA094|nr:hypothetical protein [Massilia sp. CCM 8734]
MRFNVILRLIGGVSHRMLILTLCGLERDDLVTPLPGRQAVQRLAGLPFPTRFFVRRHKTSAIDFRNLTDRNALPGKAFRRPYDMTVTTDNSRMNTASFSRPAASFATTRSCGSRQNGVGYVRITAV